MPAHFSADAQADNKKSETWKNFSHWKWPVKEDVVISGVSGRFPESDNMNELQEHLYNNDNLITQDDRRWPVGLHGIPNGFGKLKDPSKFDAEFFGFPAKMAEHADPQLRMLLEVCYEAIVDAGINPQNIRGSQTAVFTGACTVEAEESHSSDVDQISGYSLLGCSRNMLSNRISYFFDLKGPSTTLDTACSSSFFAMYKALNGIRSGEFDNALVCGTNLIFKPSVSMQFNNLSMLSPNFRCKTFDVEGDGYVRSETVAAVFLQKASEAKRVYATIIHGKTNTDGFKSEGVAFPSGAMQGKLLKTVYEEAGVDPADVAYVECHGTGTKAGDPQETNSVVEVFCKNRKGPLLVGSIKSVLGHAEPASGICQLAKIIIAMENGIIPANLHFENPNPDIPALVDGRLKVVSENTPLPGGLVGVSSFGFGGCNVHFLLRSNPKNKQKHNHSGQQLVAYSGRTEEAVQEVLEYVQKNSDPDLLALLSDYIDNPSSMHHYKGYTIFNGSEEPIVEIQKTLPEQRPLWYVFSGMGSQNLETAKDMMQFEVFSNTIHKLHKVLKPYGLDLLGMITEGTPEMFDKILNSFVFIAAVQVALVDCLRSVGLEPDGIIGHSVGEFGCAYADGCITAEQMILATYWRGYCIQQHAPPGAMAAVGLTWEECKKRCPEGVVPSCHNAEDTVTVSGPEDAVDNFVKELDKEKIFARKVQSSGVGFHCYMIKTAAPSMLSALEKVFPQAKPRTSRWISTSISEDKWGTPLAKTASANYFVNNLLSPVLLYDGLKHIPANATILEIAPHCLLQAILKRTVPMSCSNIAIAHKSNPNHLTHFYSTIGKLYSLGHNVKISNLFPEASFPVSRGTPMVSSLVKWDHHESWYIPKYTDFACDKPSGFADVGFTIDVSEPTSESHYLIDHTIDGRVIFPGTGYLVLVWKAFAKTENIQYDKLAVQFENVSLHRATILPKEGSVTLNVTIMKGGGEFEILEGGSIVVTGNIYKADGRPHDKLASSVKRPTEKSTVSLTKADVYKELRLRGYEYGPHFQGIEKSDLTGNEGKLRWNGNWITFMDTMLQFSILNKPFRHLCLPTRFAFLRISPEEHENHALGDEEKVIEVVYDEELNVCVAGGVQIKGLKASATSRRANERHPILEEYHFIPHIEDRVFANSPVVEKQLRDYNATCVNKVVDAAKRLIAQKKEYLPNVTLLQIIAKTSLQPVDKVPSYANNTDFNAKLIEFLDEVVTIPVDTSYEQNLQPLLEHFWQSTAIDDTLLSSACHNRVMKPCLDIVSENFLARTLHVVEVESSKSSICEAVLNSYSNEAVLQVDFDLTDENEDCVTPLAEKLVVNAATWNASAASYNGSEAHLIVGSHFLSRNRNHIETALENIKKSLKNGGFALFHEYQSENALAKFLSALSAKKVGFINEELEGIFKKADLKVICRKYDGILNTLYLVRKVSPVKEPVTLNIDNEDSSTWVEKLKHEIQEITKKPAGVNLYITSEKQPLSGIVGIVNCLKAEGSDRVRCVFNASKSQKFQKPFQYNGMYEKDLVMNVYNEGQWGSYRFQPIEHEANHSIQAEHAYVNVQQRGDLSSLRWYASPLNAADLSSVKDNLCHVYYAPLNFRDIMLATGKLPPEALPGNASIDDCILGLEFSGRTAAGKRVMGLVSAKGLATTVVSDPVFTWEVPDKWTLEEAATVPVVFSTAYYALVVRGQLRPGESVLIHSGSGGVGQAAISIALHMGCTVYTTVGSNDKKEYLKKMFPKLKDVNFSNSRDVTFEYDIMRATKGKGVDVVLNSLSEEKLQASVRCLALHGRFLEIGKYDLSKNSPLGMSCFLLNTTFHGILLDALFDTDSPINNQLKKMIEDGIKSGAVVPLKRTVFESDQLEDAFRFMASGKHIGKVLIKVRDEESAKTAKASSTNMHVCPQVICHPKKTYIITGGLGGFGMELANWLIDHGARHLVLSSRSGVRTGYQTLCLKRWKGKGIDVHISTHDIGTLKGVETMIQEATVSQGPVGGVFHLAAVLRDAVLENQNAEHYTTVINTKVKAINNFDQVTRKSCPKLDWFVAFSSMVAGRGNAGQTNYGYANSAMERVCEKRKEDGYPGLAIQWGGIGDVGLVHDNMGGNDIVVGGTLPQRLASCLSVMELFLTQKHPVVSSIVVADKQRRDGGTQRDIVADVARILGVKNSGALNPDLTLAEMGLDSLMGVEVKQILERDFETVLTMQEIRLLTVLKLRELASSSDGESTEDVSTNTETEKNYSTTNVIRYNLNELVPKKCVVSLNDKKTGKPLFIVHPVEGGTQMLETVAKNITCPVYGLQCTQNTPTESVTKTATYYLQEMQKVQPEGPYNIGGYSYGATIAIEMTIQLQNYFPGKPHPVKNLILFDGSHQYVSAHTIGYTDSADAAAHADGLLTFTQMFMNIDFKKEKQRLVQLETWPERVSHIADTLMASKLFKNREEVSIAAELFYNRVAASHVYQCGSKITSAVTLIRAKQNNSAVDALGKDYALDKICMAPVAVHVVEGGHEDFILEPNATATAQVVNKVIRT